MGIEGVTVACTSNCKLRDFEERFQTRFQAFEIAPPTTEDIVGLLRRYLPDEPEVVNAATFADGNVRQALLDAKRLVQRSQQLLAGITVRKPLQPLRATANLNLCQRRPTTLNPLKPT